MKREKVMFKDPNGKFTIGVYNDWKLNNDKPNLKRGLFQFETSKKCMFQISCKEIDDDILKIIEVNKLIPHDFSLPNISFYEKYTRKEEAHIYSWICQIEDHFILATYFYDEKFKPQDLALELMEIRMSLQNFDFIRKDKKEGNVIQEKILKEKDYSDIENWRNPPSKFYNYLTKEKGKLNSKIKYLSPVNVDVVKLYSLLKTKISHQPNGFYDMLSVGSPLDNMIWWDFILECDKGFIQISRTPFVIEAIYQFDGDFNLLLFLNNNIKKYSKNISESVKSFEKHTLYINHYKSYDECVNTLWSEIEKIDLTIPKTLKKHLSEEENDVKNYAKQVTEFSKNSIKYHALAKSLVLNAAFKVESFLNLVIRVGSKPELKLYPDIMNKFLRQDFKYRLKNMKFHSSILIKDIDLSSSFFRESQELMNLRNKYVHFDEDTRHNKLGEVYYDRDYPLLPAEDSRPAIESIIKMYHKPNMEAVKKAKKTSETFVSNIIELINPKIKKDLIFLFNQNPLSYNETKGVYSSVFNPNSVDFFASSGEED